MGVVRGLALVVAGFSTAATLSGVAPSSAAADPAGADPAAPSVVTPQPERTARDVLRYWTPERMAAALPIEDVLPNLVVPAADDARGDRQAPRTAAAPRPRAPRSTGKLFFSDSGGDYVCSAAAIKSRKRNQVITAGHCVHTGPNVPILQSPHFFSDWLFVPRYRNGRAPHGRWVGKNAYAFNGWIENEAYRYDQAIVSFKRRNGRRLVDVVGGNEVVWGNDQRQWGTTIWGWPAEDPYDGEVARTCDGRTRPFQESADAAMHRCDLNGGASGGPWYLPRGRKDGTGRIWAVTSRRLLDRPVLLARPIPRQIRQMIRAANR